MGRELSMNRPPVHTSSDERESKVREVVNRVSGDELCSYLQGEMEQFLDFLHDDGNRRLFFSRLPCNILTMRDLERIRDDVAAAKGLAPAHVHPFCEMFNLGLLGCLKVDALGDGRVQAFKKPSEFDWTMAGILPRQERLFFLPPSAQSTIRALNPSYFTYRGIVVGDGLLWSPANEELLRQQQIRIFISYCSAERRVVEGLEAELPARSIAAASRTTSGVTAGAFEPASPSRSESPKPYGGRLSPCGRLGALFELRLGERGMAPQVCERDQ
jgi:hypothetical protein